MKTARSQDIDLHQWGITHKKPSAWLRYNLVKLLQLVCLAT